MLKRFSLFMLSVLFLSGCVTTAGKNNSVMELQECQSRISLLEAELKDKDKELARLEQDLRNKERESYKQEAPAGITDDSTDISTPSSMQIQKALKNAGYYSGAVDGKVGPKTQEAIINFQKDNGLKADGKVGQKTWSQLKGYLNQ